MCPASIEIYTYGHTLSRHVALPIWTAEHHLASVGNLDFHIDRGLADGVGGDLAVRLNGDEDARLGRAVKLLQVHAEGAVKVEDVGADGLAGGIGEVDAGEAEGVLQRPVDQQRSEEHTSELQSLMRISYAVFCLKKKKYKQERRVTVRKE